jgi:hypothetical protein
MTARACVRFFLLAIFFAVTSRAQDSTPATNPAPAATPRPGASPTPATNQISESTEARAIVGYHQAGASSANFTQNFFFDFYINRVLSKYQPWDKNERWSLWGDVRIASTPQQVTTDVGTFVTNFGTEVSKVPVNQLAQSADFDTGLEFRLKTIDPDDTKTAAFQHRTLGAIAYVGAMGEFQTPQSQMQIFDVPSTSSPQYPAFVQQFPSAANATYVGFVPPNRERFYRNYGAGLRVTTYATAPNPPATYTISLGEDEAITGGIFRSVVGKIDVFYPLPLPGTANKYKCVYLFGDASLRLSRATNVPTFALENPNANSVTVQPYDPGLAIITVRSARDTYRIGVGVDLISLFGSIGSNKSSGASTPHQ